MQLPSFLQKFGRDIVYISIISGLLGWIWVDGRRDKKWNETLAKDFATFDEFISLNNRSFFTLIEKSVYDYYYQPNIYYGNQTVLVKKNILAFNQGIHQILSNLGLPEHKNDYSQLRNPSPTELGSLMYLTRNLNDSLMLYVDNDSTSTVKIKRFLAQNSNDFYWDNFKCQDPIQSVALIRNLLIRSELAYYETMNHLARKISGCGVTYDYYPLAVSERPTIRKGETYEAEICLVGEYKNPSNLVIKVNDIQLPATKGKALYSHLYNSAGVKKYTVIIEIKNPFTDYTEIVSKEYSLLVVDSCQ
jgi:hypothetical protein